jgi:phosphoglycolate phosphatase-like HAD superfamily hydrolase
MTMMNTDLDFLVRHTGDHALTSCYNVMLDVDSIIYPLLVAMNSRPGGARVNYDDCMTFFGLADLVDGGKDRMFEMFEECFDYQVMRNHSPFDGASQMTQMLANAGVRFHIKTARPVCYAQGTSRYLQEHGIAHVSFACQEPFDKVSQCLAEDIGIAVDDHPHFMQQATQAGITALSLRWHYNSEAMSEHGLPSATCWQQLGGHIASAVASRIRAAL